MDVVLKRGDEELQAQWQFATWADVGELQGWSQFLIATSSDNMKDAADFARQAIDRWSAYADKGLTAISLDDAYRKSLNAPHEEFAALLVLKATWWFQPDQPVSFAYFRRTWCGGFYLEFMAGHPLTEGKIKGILRATMMCLVQVAQKSESNWIWWEATRDSFDKYQSIVQERNLLFSTQPPIKDLFIVATEKLSARLAEPKQNR